jgi:hypothetical protein
LEVRAVETTKQVSVFLENKPGRLAKVISALAREKVNVTALSIMDSHEHSVLRVVTNDPSKTSQILKGLSIPCTEVEVMLVELKNQPGALAHVCELLAGEHINIEYAYVSSGARNGRVLGIFKVSNTEKALRALNETGNYATKKRLERRPPRDRRSYHPPSVNSH